MNLQLFDKVVLISGGPKGIGAATAHALVQEGAVPAILDRDAEAGEELSTELRRAGARSLVISTDLTSSENCFHAVEQAAKELGKIDALINNAGIKRPHRPGGRQSRSVRRIARAQPAPLLQHGAFCAALPE